jgi:hypothetical protein
MRIGDIEYTRRIDMSTGGVANVSSIVDVQFALGIKIRPLWTRAQVAMGDASAITGSLAVFFENATSVAGAASAGALNAEPSLFPIYFQDYALSTNGIGISAMFESTWWKLLLPQIRLHLVASTLTGVQAIITLHYRFAELTDDEIVEIAAQRAQS